MYRYRIVRKNELYHHGIDGMKWGVRNGPPYPLDQKTHNEVVRKGYVRDRDESRAKGVVKLSKRQGIAKAYNRIDRNWKEVINSSDLPEVINVADGLANGSLSHLKRLEENELTADDLASCNYGYGKPGTTSNCAKCSATLEMRFRGYDVSAGRCFMGTNNGYSSYWFDGATDYKEKGFDNYANRVDKVFGNNGRGCLDFRYPDNKGGHSMYAMYDKDRVFHILDGQNNREFSVQGSSRSDSVKRTLEQVRDYYGFDLDNSWNKVTRWDTASPNYSHMSEDSVLRVDYTNENMNQMQRRSDGKFGIPVNFTDGSKGFTNIQIDPIKYR